MESRELGRDRDHGRPAQGQRGSARWSPCSRRGLSAWPVVLGCLLAAVLGAAPVAASPEPREIMSVSVLSRRGAVATFDRSGWCALRVAGQWVEFSRDRGAAIHQELEPGVSVVLEAPMAVARAHGVVILVSLAATEGEGGSMPLTLARSRPRDGVPVFLLEFVSQACVMTSPADVQALSRLGEVPPRARRQLVQILSLAAFRRYHGDDSPTSSDAPFTQIPHWGRRCAMGRDCDLWATSVVRGFEGSDTDDD